MALTNSSWVDVYKRQGYGCVYFAQNMLATRNDDLQGKVCLVSGSGNVAQYLSLIHS